MHPRFQQNRGAFLWMSQGKVVCYLMRLLLTAELGWTYRWFGWLGEASKDYDLVAIAGDFINVFRPEPLNVQILKAKAFLRSLARKTRVAFSRVIMTPWTKLIFLRAVQYPCGWRRWIRLTPW